MLLHIFPYFNFLCIVGGHKQILLRDQPAGRADNSVEFDKMNSKFNNYFPGFITLILFPFFLSFIVVEDCGLGLQFLVHGVFRLWSSGLKCF